MMEEFAGKLAKKQVQAPKKFIAAILLITLFLMPGIINIKLEPSLEKVLPTHIPVIETMNDMRAQFGADMIYVLVESESALDVRRPEVISYLDVLSGKIVEDENVLEVQSLATLVKENKGFIPDSYRQIKEILRSDIRTTSFTNPGYSLTFLQVRTDTGANAQLINQVKRDIQDDLDYMDALNPGIKTHITGFNVIDKATFDIMMSDFAFETPLSFIFIGIIVYVTFRSMLKGFLPMVVVMLSMVWTMGLIGYSGLILSSTNIVAAAMIMGLGIDFGVHIVHRFYELKESLPREQAMIDSLKENFRAIVAASLTTTAGFLALLFGSLPAMQNFGIILSIGILSAMFASILALPPVILIYDKTVENKNR